MKRSIVSVRHFLVGLLVLGCFAHGIRLQAQDTRASVATAFENSGDYKSAARLWQSVLSDNPNDDRAFFGVVRSLKALQNYAGLTDIVEQKLQHKRSRQVLVVWAQVLVKTNRGADADGVWDEILSSDKAKPDLFAEVAKAQLEVQQSANAIATLLKARSACDDDGLFADDLSQLYAANGDYRHGSAEVLTAFFRSGNLQMAEGRLSAFMQGDTAMRYLKQFMSEQASTYDDKFSFLRLYQWFLRESKSYDEAFVVAQRMDKLHGGNGRDVIEFADQCRMDGHQDVAIKAYSFLVAQKRHDDIGQSAAFGYASCMEARFREGKVLQSSEVEPVIAMYRDIISDFPNTYTAADAQLHIARCYDRYLHDSPSAIKEYTVLTQSYTGFPQSSTGTVELGLAYLHADDLDHARTNFTLALSLVRVGTSASVSQAALFYLAELNFYQCQFDSALSYYNRIEQHAESEFANDAIERLTAIALHRDDSLDFQLYAHACMRVAQYRYADACVLLDQVGSQSRDADLAEVALVMAADVSFKAADYPAVYRYVDRLKQRNAESIYADKALYLNAQSLEAEGKNDLASQKYLELLARFPSSPFIQDSREKIRKLRGES